MAMGMFIAWIILGFISSGFIYAKLQRDYYLLADKDRKADTVFSLAFSMLGPIALIISLSFEDYKFGWLFPGMKSNKARNVS